MTDSIPTFPSRRRRISSVVALMLALGIQAAAIFLAAGYHAAFGRTDAAGHVLGFNDPIMPGHLRLMADSLNASAVWSEINILSALPVLVTLAALVGATCSPVDRAWLRCFVRHSLLFVALCLGSRSLDLIHGHRWTGECIDEGELSFAMVGLLWVAAWIPVLSWELARWFKNRATLSRGTQTARFPA